MNIGIYSKVGSSGGSEWRVVEMANAIVNYTKHDVQLLCEKKLNETLAKKLDIRVQKYENVLDETGRNLRRLYESDTILIVNSDSYSFSKYAYWNGETEHHPHKVDLSKIKQMIFLYNFVLSPATNLCELSKYCPDIRIICANKEWYHKISNDEKYEKIRHLPRITLDSPIDPTSITTFKNPTTKIRIGKHSKAHSFKWNDDHYKLITHFNQKYPDQLQWNFLGMPKTMSEIIRGPNIVSHPEYSVPVGKFLMDIDIFLFLITYTREEPWSRALAEASAASCAILATNKAGNKDQIIHGNNGFLCNDYNDFVKYLDILIQDKILREQMGRNGHIYSKEFTPDKIIHKFVDFTMR